MSNKMRVAVMNAPGQVTIQERPLPLFGSTDVLVKVAYVGICGSDMALFANGYIGTSIVKEPMVLGHEASGVVVGIGSAVNHLKVGDRVALEPGIPCGSCQFCVEGRYNLCPRVFFWASLPNTEGALQDFVRHPAAFCHQIPDSMTLVEAALVEPLAVAFHAVRQAQVRVGDRALVLGAGAVGLLTMLTLKAAGVAEVTLVDLMENRRANAVRLGARALDPETLDEVQQTFSSNPESAPHIVFETAGSQETMDRAIALARRGGTVVFVGYTKDGRADLNVNLLIDKELTLKSVFRYRNCYPAAIAAAANGLIPLKEVASNIYPFEQVQQAMALAIGSKNVVTKAVIAVNPEEDR